MTILLDPLTLFASPSNPQGKEAPAPELWANPPRIVDVEFRVQCDSLVCNYHKGPNIGGVDPESKKPAALFNPRLDRWADHFRWDGLQIAGRTAVGRTTVWVLKMNSPRQLAVRLALLRSGWLLSELT